MQRLSDRKAIPLARYNGSLKLTRHRTFALTTATDLATTIDRC